MANESLSDAIRGHLNGIDDLMQVANPREKANQIRAIADEHKANRDSVASIFNRELKQLIKKNGLDVGDFFPRIQTKKYSDKLDVVIKSKPVQVDKTSKDTEKDPTKMSPKSSKEPETITDEDCDNIATVTDSLMSSLFPNIEDLTEKERKGMVASLKLVLGDNAKTKPIIGLAGIVMTYARRIKKARRIKEEKKQAEKVIWNGEI